MKIGIITWFKYENYGTILQAIALQRYLRNNKFEVELVNFDIDDTINLKKSNKEKITKRIYYKIAKEIYFFEKKKHKEEFNKKTYDFKNIIEKNCKIRKKKKNEEDYIGLCNNYDILIFGSDQIWNPNWYNPFYYGNYKKITTKLIAYAPSFGVNEIPEDKKQKIKEALKRFDNIALREEQGCNIVKGLLDVETDIVVDPTLLLSEKDWEILEEDLEETKEKYILCYFLSDNPYHWRAAKKFAKKKKMKLIIIPHDGFSYIESKYVVRGCNVGNFLSLIHNAQYVITDSFHAIVFSIIYNKKFIVFERHNPNSKFAQNSRIYNFLKLTDTEKCLVKYNTSEIKESQSLKYNKESNNISALIEKSKKYLEENLKEK